MSCIKSIQRGYERKYNTYTGDKTITLKTQVNPEKCIVLLDYSSDANDSGNCVDSINYGAILVGLTSTTLTLHISSYAGNWMQYSWQVIEFA